MLSTNGSIIMVARHDSSDFCHEEWDHCLDRLRASLSTHLHTLHVHGLDDSSEIILVEWNPCTDENLGAAHCDTSKRDGRAFMPLVQAVERLVAPSPVRAHVRVLTVSPGLRASRNLIAFTVVHH